MASPVVHFEIMAKPGEKPALQEFYRKTFGWNIENVPGPYPYGMLVKPDDEKGIGGAVDEVETAGDAQVMIYIEVADPQAALDEAIANGGTKVKDVVTIPGMVTMAVFKDPAGNAIGLVASETPPEA